MNQPLGIVAGPAGALLLPDIGDGDAHDRVMRGDLHDLPPAWAFYGCAAGGDRAGALRALDAAVAPAAQHGYNRFVLTGDPALFAQLHARADGDDALLLACAGYLHGVCDTLPDAANAADPIVAAYVGAAGGGPAALRAAALSVIDASPVFAGRLFADCAAALAADPDRTDDALAAYEAAWPLLAASALRDDAAELALAHGLFAHERAGGRRDRLLAAIGAYQRALHAFAKTGPHAEAYAIAQMNLGLAYLALPMGGDAERLRPAIAVQSLREAAAAVDREKSPALWASATLNLANALQHANSAHVEENLWEAVALYEDALAAIGGADALRRARVLANQGNALAHLGAFSRAEPRLHEAVVLFDGHGEPESAAAIGDVLAEIAARRATAGSSRGPA